MHAAHEDDGESLEEYFEEVEQLSLKYLAEDLTTGQAEATQTYKH